MQTPDVAQDETLLRQIHPGGNPIFFDPMQNPPIHHSVFRPTDRDTDGLSLIRQRFRTDIWAAYRLEQPAIRFRLARLSVAKLSELAEQLGLGSLSFPHSPDGLDNLHGQPWAHCVLSEINRNAYDSTFSAKVAIKEWMLAVAKSIAIEAVIGPFEEPNDTHPYRPDKPECESPNQ